MTQGVLGDLTRRDVACGPNHASGDPFDEPRATSVFDPRHGTVFSPKSEFAPLGLGAVGSFPKPLRDPTTVLRLKQLQQRIGTIKFLERIARERFCAACQMRNANVVCADVIS